MQADAWVEIQNLVRRGCDFCTLKLPSSVSMGMKQNHWNESAVLERHHVPSLRFCIAMA